MGIDYGEIFCNAVDEIITSRLQDLQYDITKLCTIIDDTYSNQGKYIVSDGATRYEAFSTDNNLKKGNNVMVVIPNGDYSMQKNIIGRVASTDTTPFNYTSPMDTMIKITNNIFDNSIPQEENFGLLANDNGNENGTYIGPIYSITDTADFIDFTRLGITANFCSLLNGLDVVEGLYGLRIMIQTENGPVYELTFSSADMIGNPYQFESYFYQEKVFDISSISNIKQIDVYFYQNGKFKNGNGDYIPWKEENQAGFESFKNQNNLFVNDVQIFLGYDVNAFTDETLMIYTQDSLSYRYTDENKQRNISLRWIHKIDENSFQLITNEDINTGEFEVHWFKYNQELKTVNEYAGEYWEEVSPKTNDTFSYSFTPDVEKQREYIKVVGLIKKVADGEDIENGEQNYSITPYYSNLLTFENEVSIPDDATVNASTSLSIVCMDNSEGNYPIYNQNGKINNEGLGRGYTRYFKAMYKGAEITPFNGNLDWIKWYLPIESTMIIETDDFYKENGGNKQNEIVSYKGVDYNVVIRNPNSNGYLETTQAYAINNQWSFQNSNNTIRCQVSINNIIYEAIEELRFGKGGTNGTEITFLIEFTDNNNAVIAENDYKTTVRARLYDSTGVNVGFTKEMAEQVEWSWYKRTDNKNYIQLPNNPKGASIILTSKVSSVPSDNYFILQATYQNLTAYLPIPIKTEDTVFIEGAREVIYNHQGVPSYYNDAYVIYCKDGQGKVYENKAGQWNLSYDENIQVNTGQENELSKSYIPILKQLDSRPGYKALSASPFYASGYNDKVCVSYVEEKCLWSQPILIMQSKYDFAMLNKWDGSLTIDDKNGTILSTMLGAGKKNQNNTFSGVLIGDIQGGTELNKTETLTGVYGLHEGVISYALKEDGTATFGKVGKGQIKINGNSGTIESGNFSTSNQGTLIDLDDGIIDIKWPGNKIDSSGNNLNGRIRLQPESPYLYINSTNNTTLMQIGSDSYLQSDNFSATNGTKLNLNTGTLDIRTETSQFLVSGSGSPYLKMAIPQNEDDQAYANSLLLLDKNNYYLKSKDYIENEYIKIKDYNTYKQPSNPIVNVSQIVAVTPNGQVYKTDGTNLNGIYNFQEKTITISPPTESDKDTENITTTLTADQVKQSYISQLQPNLKTTSSVTKGFKLDLNNSIINGYDLYLKGTKYGDTSKYFVLDSSATETPFKIGKFSVDWNGVLTCNKINSLSNDGSTDKAISINDNFYVTQGGSAGGSGCNFGGSFYGGFSGVGTGTFKGTGLFDTLTVSGQTQLATSGSTTTCGGNLTVNGTGTFKKDLTCESHFHATNFSILDDNINATNPLNLYKGLLLSGSGTFKSFLKAELKAGLEVTGDATISSNLTTEGKITCKGLTSSLAVDIQSGLFVKGTIVSDASQICLNGSDYFEKKEITLIDKNGEKMDPIAFLVL